jgi:hypothetical protein
MEKRFRAVTVGSVISSPAAPLPTSSAWEDSVVEPARAENKPIFSVNFNETVLQKPMSCYQFDDDHSTIGETDFASRDCASDDASVKTQASSVQCDLTNLLIQEDIQSNVMVEDEVIQVILNATFDDESSTSTFYTIDGERTEY